MADVAYCPRCPSWPLDRDGTCLLCHGGLGDPASVWFWDLCHLPRCLAAVPLPGVQTRTQDAKKPLPRPRRRQGHAPVPPHCGVLLVPELDALPTHVCYDIARASTEAFVRRHYVMTPWLRASGWDVQWPLPLGVIAGITDLRPSWGKDDHTDALPQQPGFDATDRAGLIVERHAYPVKPDARPAWSVLLIGLVERSLHPAVGEPSEDGGTEAPPVPGETFVTYQFIPAQLQLMVARRADLPVASAVAARLSRWYDKYMLGQKIGTGGRPPGAGATFRDRIEFLAGLRTAVAEAQREQRPLTIPVLGAVLAQRGCGDHEGRQLRRWLSAFGFPDLAAAIAAAEATP